MGLRPSREGEEGRKWEMVWGGSTDTLLSAPLHISSPKAMPSASQGGDGWVPLEKDVGFSSGVHPHHPSWDIGGQEDSGVGASLTHVAVDEG